MRYDKCKWQGEVVVVKTLRNYPHEAVFHLWLDEEKQRVYCTINDEPGKGFYCGEIERNMSTGQLELMVFQALDKRDNPWRYEEWHCFLYHPRKKTLLEIPRYLPINHEAWSLIYWQFDQSLDRETVCVRIYCAVTIALNEFHKHPEKKEMGMTVGNIPLVIRGHGYYKPQKQV